MTRRSLPPALRAAGIVGTWTTNVSAGRSVLDDGAAAVMAGDAALAGQPLTLDRALACIHPADRAWVFERIRRIRETGGFFTAEFRVRSETGAVRWILNQGHLPGAGEGEIGYGTYIDTTVRHLEDDGDAGPDMLEIAADHCIAARAAIERSNQPLLRLLVDALLLEIGRHLARRRAH